MTFQVWCPYYGYEEEDAKAIDAPDAEDAAIEWARDFDVRTAEYPFLDGSGRLVLVKDGDGVTTAWAVIGESVPQYSATVVLPPERSACAAADTRNLEAAWSAMHPGMCAPCRGNGVQYVGPDHMFGVACTACRGSGRAA